MNNSKIDEAILSYLTSANGNWRKVAMVIVMASETLKADLPEGKESHNLIAERIEALVSEGRLTAQGDLKKWRNSEVRIPQNLNRDGF